jgi:hypothetical protein
MTENGVVCDLFAIAACRSQQIWKHMEVQNSNVHLTNDLYVYKHLFVCSESIGKCLKYLPVTCSATSCKYSFVRRRRFAVRKTYICCKKIKAVYKTCQLIRKCFVYVSLLTLSLSTESNTVYISTDYFL